MKKYIRILFIMQTYILKPASTVRAILGAAATAALKE